MMLKKYLFLCCFCFLTADLCAQLSCPNFKIRGNKSPRSHPFTTAIKFQLDGMAQYQGISPQYKNHLGFYPALSFGLEQTLLKKLSISATHGWTFNAQNYNSRFVAGDVRLYFDHCFEGKWLSARITLTDNIQAADAVTMQPFLSIHYGKTATYKHVFTHYEMGIGFGEKQVIVLMFGAATGLKLN